MQVSSPRNSDEIGLGYPMDIRVCSCLLGNSNRQTGLRATEPTEVKFACPIISFVVVLSALSFCSGTLTSHHFMLSNLGQVA